jgi:hypothetical protein
LRAPRRLAATLALLAALTVVAAPAPAAPGDVPPDTSGDLPGDTSGDLTGLELGDIVQLVPGMIRDLVDHRADMLRCPSLAGGTVGTGESRDQPGRTGPDQGNPLRAGDPTDAPSSLPDQVVFRSTTQTYNRRYQFAVARGTIWYKSNTAVTGIHEPWAHLTVPGCFEGRVSQISADDDELIAVDRDRWIYDLDGILRTPKYFTWSLRWGPPFWTGPGMRLPRDIRTWSWSVVSPLEDGTWLDPAGNHPAIGNGKVSHIWLLRHHGQWLTFMDPWLPVDQSYEMCGPHRGRFRSANMSASGSTIFVIGRYGDLYTRLFDFDISGDDSLFFKYSYADQRGLADPRIQLPAAGWVHQPKIPGVVTDRISIEKVGRGTVHRILRVEGRHHGHVGYWQKDITARHWHFVRTDGHLVGHRLPNPRRDTSTRGLGPSGDRSFTGTAHGNRITVVDFNPYCTPARVRVRLGTGERFTLRLHTVDNIRQSARARGLDEHPRTYAGMLEVPPRLRRTADAHVRAFLDSLGTGRWVGANLDATATTLAFRHQPWRLHAR